MWEHSSALTCSRLASAWHFTQKVAWIWEWMKSGLDLHFKIFCCCCCCTVQKSKKSSIISLHSSNRAHTHLHIYRPQQRHAGYVYTQISWSDANDWTREGSECIPVLQKALRLKQKWRTARRRNLQPITLVAFMEIPHLFMSPFVPVSVWTDFNNTILLLFCFFIIINKRNNKSWSKLNFVFF